jgi:hypothetical protein
MRAAFFSVIAASLLVHATFGSCLHHGCDAAICIDSKVAMESADDCDHDCCHGDSGHRQHAPGKGHSHCRGTCNYLPAKNTQISKCLLSVPVDFAVGTSAEACSQVTNLRLAASTGELVLEPPLRLHLLNQILLI